MKNNFIDFLEPQNVFLSKKRFGPLEDGGYVLPEYILENCSGLFTYGVGNEYRFEEEFAKQYKKPAYLFDHTIGRGRFTWQGLEFIPIGLGTGPNCKEYYQHYEEYQMTGNTLLKIDIEGGEYSYFLNADISKIESTVMGLILEVHWIDSIQYRNYFMEISKRLNPYFILNHIHGNNWGGVWEFEGQTIPNVIELSFINRRFVERYEPDTQDYPIDGLDVPNNPKLKDYSLSFLK